MQDDTAETAQNTAAAFRRHRHEVLNALQLIKGYIQLGHPDRALHSVDRLAVWLTGLSRWHTVCPAQDSLLWQAAGQSSVALAAVVPDQPPWRCSPGLERDLLAAWQWLQGQAAELGGSQPWQVTLRAGQRQGEILEGVELDVARTENTGRWWDNLQTNGMTQPWSHVVLGCSGASGI